MGLSVIPRYFAQLEASQLDVLNRACELYKEWNERINVVSRKDIDHIETHHILHSMVIAKIIQFKPGTKILDIGTGGGFPGLPLAILFPETEFLLVDSIRKKLKVVEEIAQELKVTNVATIHDRAEKIEGKFDFVLSRAVAPLKTLLLWSKNKFASQHYNDLPNGMICLKGGDLENEITEANKPVNEIEIASFFEEPYFQEKKILFIPQK